ncbi:SDR family oxidoreductase [Mucilaginibacter sp.]|uniref:SDR family oxidoreductase n=1 Tax=Mucilaginibacter sp. TaxID=1882438 RepID=UPI0026025DE4|nr:SDR family oxidoreductase [Mucilaginibacter sp.]MDB4926657.1 biosynthesis protein WbpP [Mucilaginibacter sp.]
MYDKQYHTKDLRNLQFLVTGGAGFIGSNLVEYLLKYGAGKVRVLDNFSTGFYYNIEKYKTNPAFELIEGDIRNFETCKKAIEGMDYVSHHAALGSVPRSINDPLSTNEVNISGFLNMLWAVKEHGHIKRMVYAASSSTYGDSKELPKVEDKIGKPLSPYAVTKLVNELYADVFTKTYGIETIGLRYFNIFGHRQSPLGEYAAVIPLFIKAVDENLPAGINGDGEQTRDFTYIENAIQANIKALFVGDTKAINQIYNIACGERTSLNNIWEMVNEIAGKNIKPLYKETRSGDIKDSLADISKAASLLGYQPQFSVREGLKLTIANKLQLK